MQTQTNKLEDKLRDLRNFIMAQKTPYDLLEEDVPVTIKAGELAAILQHLVDDVDVMISA